jgi:molybdopterin molybdotransferase
MELFNVVTVPEARRLISQNWEAKWQIERVSLTEALGRRLAADVFSREEVPGFTRSTVDGFALRAEETFGATETLPACFELMGEIQIGVVPEISLSAGQAARISTGGMLPPGANAVVMLEHTELLDPESLAVIRPVAPGENLVFQGEDVAGGSQVLTAGHRLRPQDLGLLAAVGITAVPVRLPMKVGIISTGNELVMPENEPLFGQVRDINSYVLSGLVQESGGLPLLFGIARDDPDAILALAEKALSLCDLVLISGGSSVGSRDYTVQVLKSLGTPGILFHGVSLKPGKPTLAAVAGDRLVFGLPGHPVSVMVVFDLLIKPLLSLGEYGQERHPAVRAKMTRSLASGAGREEHIRVRLIERDGELWADPVLGKSGLISTMVKAQGTVVIPLEAEGLSMGQEVGVHLF